MVIEKSRHPAKQRFAAEVEDAFDEMEESTWSPCLYCAGNACYPCLAYDDERHSPITCHAAPVPRAPLFCSSPSI